MKDNVKPTKELTMGNFIADMALVGLAYAFCSGGSWVGLGVFLILMSINKDKEGLNKVFPL